MVIYSLSMHLLNQNTFFYFVFVMFQINDIYVLNISYWSGFPYDFFWVLIIISLIMTATFIIFVCTFIIFMFLVIWIYMHILITIKYGHFRSLL